MKFDVKIKQDTKELDKLIANFKDTKIVNVGIIGGEQQDGISLASIGAVQELGSVVNNIPRRSFIKEPLLAHLSEKIKRQKEKLKQYLFIDKRLDEAYNLMGNTAVDIIIRSFRNKNDGKWVPNAPITINGGWMKNKKTGKLIKIKGKDKDNPLIDTGRLRRSITYELIDKK